jgi:hypothetical protein
VFWFTETNKRHTIVEVFSFHSIHLP